MRAGALRTRVTFIQGPTGRNAYNERATSTDYANWTPVLSTWATIQPLRGGLLELAQASTATQTATHSVTIRYNPSVRVTHRIVVGGPIAVPHVPVSWESMTDDDWNDFTFDSEPVTPIENPAPVIHYTIQAGPLDVDNRHQMMQFVCTQVIL